MMSFTTAPPKVEINGTRAGARIQSSLSLKAHYANAASSSQHFAASSASSQITPPPIFGARSGFMPHVCCAVIRRQFSRRLAIGDSGAFHACRLYVAGKTTGIPTRTSTAMGLLDRSAGLNFQRPKAARAA